MVLGLVFIARQTPSSTGLTAVPWKGSIRYGKPISQTTIKVQKTVATWLTENLMTYAAILMVTCTMLQSFSARGLSDVSFS